MAVIDQDVLIIGSGAAGLTLALNLPRSVSCTVLSKRDLTDANTFWAQGGVAAVMDRRDSISSHIEDTMRAGGGLCHADAVEFTVRHGPDAIRWLIEQGVAFSTLDTDDKDTYHLTREGGHSHRRVIHAADATGKAISETLIERVQALPHVRLVTHHVAIDLIVEGESPDARCVGAYVLNIRTGKVDTYRARAVVLATGGASKVYLYTSNPDVATGDGIAMAWRAGCRVANMEFNQFHPTCLYHPKAKSFLVTEAVRGEGGRLLLPDGSEFMHRFDKRGALAPRDIVARAIDFEMKRLGADCLYLDISHKPYDFILSHFPTVYARCLSLGIDITRDPIPIVPAAHYTCGGVMVDQYGCTDRQRLFCVGESAFTGLHGANRMASNSLLECFVYARSAADYIAKHIREWHLCNVPAPWDESLVTDSDEDVVISHNWDEIRRFMWDYVGIVRTDKRLARARNRIRLLQQEINDYYSNYRVTPDLLDLRNLALTAELIIESAISRKESRGLHYTLDYPDTLPHAVDTVLSPDIIPAPKDAGTCANDARPLSTTDH